MAVIKKVTNGFVIQSFDTETRRFVGQEFIAGDSVWERENGDALNTRDNEDLALIYGLGGVDEPYLPFEMRQPPAPEPPTPLTASATSFEEGEQVLVTPSDDPNDLVRNEFMGVVVGFKDGNLVTVKDQNDDCFDVDAIQCHHVK